MDASPYLQTVLICVTLCRTAFAIASASRSQYAYADGGGLAQGFSLTRSATPKAFEGLRRGTRPKMTGLTR